MVLRRTGEELRFDKEDRIGRRMEMRFWRRWNGTEGDIVNVKTD